MFEVSQITDHRSVSECTGLCFRFCSADSGGGGCAVCNTLLGRQYRRAASLRSLRSCVSSPGSVVISRRPSVPSARGYPDPTRCSLEAARRFRRPAATIASRPLAACPQALLCAASPFLHRSRCPAAPGRGLATPRLLPAAPLAPAG